MRIALSMLLAIGTFTPVQQCSGFCLQEAPGPSAFERLLLSQKRVFLFFQNKDGKLIRREQENGSVPIVDFFVHPVIVDELKLDRDQVRQIRTHSAALTKSIANLQERQSAGQRDDPIQLSGKGNAASELLSAVETFFDQSRKELSSEQNQRLREIQWRFIISRNGVANVLRNPVALEVLGIDQDLKQSLPRLPIDETVNWVRSEEQRILTRVLDQWLARLKPEQRELFDRDRESTLAGTGALGQLYWHLDYPNFAPYRRTSARQKLIRFAPSTPQLLHGADGNIDVQLAKTKIEYSNLQRLNVLRRTLNSVLVRDLLDIVDFQVEEQARIGSRFDELRHQIVAETAEEFGVPSKTTQTTTKFGTTRELVIYQWPEDMSEISAANERRLSEKAGQCFDDLVNVLLPPQQERLHMILSRLEIRSRGPWADIQHGDLDQVLELSESQRDHLDTSRSDCIDFIETETRSVVETALSDILEYLPESVRSKLKSAMGAPIQNGSCDLSTFRIALLRNAPDR